LDGVVIGVKKLGLYSNIKNWVAKGYEIRIGTLSYRYSKLLGYLWVDHSYYGAVWSPLPLSQYYTINAKLCRYPTDIVWAGIRPLQPILDFLDSDPWDDLDSQDTTIDQYHCDHEFVNVGFNTILMVCKHCNMEKP
jgi:hypothetical protein